MAVTARKRLLDMAATDKIQFSAYHLPFPLTGFISKRGDGYEFHPAYWQPCCSRGHAETSEAAAARPLAFPAQCLLRATNGCEQPRQKCVSATHSPSISLGKSLPLRTPPGRHFPPLCILSTMAHRQGEAR